LGGPPSLASLISYAFRRAFPKGYLALDRTLTIPATTTLHSLVGDGEGGRPQKWLKFELLTGRNSNFRIEGLSTKQLLELGGTEYSALRYLVYLLIFVTLFRFVFWAGTNELWLPLDSISSGRNSSHSSSSHHTSLLPRSTIRYLKRSLVWCPKLGEANR
jgi:hypothetical protein